MFLLNTTSRALARFAACASVSRREITDSVAPASVRMDGMFEDEEARPRKPRTPFFQDTKSQIMLLLVLIAMFPYIVFFYVKPSLFPRGYQPPTYAAESKKPETEDRGKLEELGRNVVGTPDL